MKVVDIFKIKNRGVVVVLDERLPYKTVKLGSVVKRIDDNQTWIISGYEKWSNNTADALLLKGEVDISIGDELEFN